MSLSSIYTLHRQNGGDQVATILSKGTWLFAYPHCHHPGWTCSRWSSCLSAVMFPGTLNFRPSGKTNALVNNSSVLRLRAVVVTVRWSQAQNRLTKLGSRDVLVLGCPCAVPGLDGSPGVGNTSWSHAVCRFCEPACSKAGEVRSLGLCFFLWYNAELVLGTRSSYRAWVLHLYDSMFFGHRPRNSLPVGFRGGEIFLCFIE